MYALVFVVVFVILTVASSPLYKGYHLILVKGKRASVTIGVFVVFVIFATFAASGAFISVF